MPVDDPPLKIAFTATELGVGGAERCLTHLAIGLQRRGHAVEVYSLAPTPARDRSTLVDQLRDAQIPLHFLGLTSSWQFFSGVRALRRLLAGQQPELMQTFLFHANVLGVMAARKANVPRIVQGVRVADPTGWRRRVEGHFMRRVDRVVCVSQSVRDFAAEQSPNCPLVVIPNGVDVPSFRNAAPADLTSLGISRGRRMVLFVGRLHPQKGLDRLLPHLPAALRDLPQHDLLIVGDGPDASELKQQVRALDLTERVQLVGQRSDVPSLLAASEMLVLPSRFEGMPNVVMEAMAAGRPVVSTRVHGVDELLGEGADEQVVDDAEALAARMTALLRDPQHARDLGARNQVRVEQHFSLDAMISAYERLYQELGRQ